MESPMLVTARAILFGLWLAEQSLRNDGFDLADAFQRGQEIGLPGTVYDGGSKSPIAVPDLLQKAYDAMRIGSTDGNGEFATIHDGTDNYIHTAGWWPVLDAINRQHCRLKPFPLPDDPDERIKMLCQNIQQTNNGVNLNMALVNATLREQGVPEKLDGYGIGDKGTTRVEFHRHLVLAHAANNSSAFITSAVCSLEYKILGETYVVERLPIPMLKICEAFLARRERLNIHCVDTLA